jgi:hypothetical protein
VAAAGRLDQAEQDPDGRGLARAVRPEEAVDAAARDGQCQVVDRHLAAAKALGQAAGGDRQAAAASGRREITGRGGLACRLPPGPGVRSRAAPPAAAVLTATAAGVARMIRPATTIRPAAAIRPASTVRPATTIRIAGALAERDLIWPGGLAGPSAHVAFAASV